MVQPVINGSTREYTQDWFDDFDGSTPLFENWQPDLMSDGLHRAGNADIDAQGNDIPRVLRDGRLVVNGSAAGKRWSAWYTQQHQTSYIDNGQLVMGALVEDLPDPTRRSYTQGGELVEWNTIRVMLSYLTTWARVYSNEANNGQGGFITDPASPDRAWGPGSFHEMQVDFSQMSTQGMRLSFWLMPAYDYTSDAYNADAADGVEIDIFEYENTPGFEQVVQMKVIGGSVLGNTPGGSVNVPKSVADFSEGPCTIGLLWETDKLVWYINGKEMQRDEDRVPQVPHYLIISRELNSGAKNNPGPGELQAIPAYISDANGDLVKNPEPAPYIPEDAGLYAKNAWFHRDRMSGDKGFIDYVRVWSVGETIVEPVEPEPEPEPPGEPSEPPVVIPTPDPNPGPDPVLGPISVPVEDCRECGAKQEPLQLMPHATILNMDEIFASVDPSVFSDIQVEYTFSNGRKFRNK